MSGEDARTGLADGDWHRLHPATPLLRGGIGLLAALGLLITNMGERMLNGLLGGPADEWDESDPLEMLVDGGLLGAAIGAGAGVLLLCVVGFHLAWRMHTFRITQEAVEVRRGILSRTNRKARLDRVQGINLSRPLLARVFGVARLEITQAGQDANVELSYLSSAQADDLRLEVLRLASGAQRAAEGEAPAALEDAHSEGSGIERRINELLAPELDPRLAPPESVVRLDLGRLIGSTVASETTVVFVLLLAGATVGIVLSGEFLAVFGLLPAIFGVGSYLVSKVVRSLRYTIAGTPDGVRVGFGLLSTSNDTLPPGRIHSLSISQSLLWRPFGWWQVKVNRASRSGSAQQQQQRSLILPVGDIDDVVRVLTLVLPGLQNVEVLRDGLVAPGPVDGFVTSPRRAAVLRWFSWRRNGYALLPDVVALRRGAVWRELVIVPQPRLQSVAVTQGPLLRSLDLAAVTLHTVAGPISGRIGALDRQDGLRLFAGAARAAVDSASSDTSHRWRSREVAP